MDKKRSLSEYLLLTQYNFSIVYSSDPLFFQTIFFLKNQTNTTMLIVFLIGPPASGKTTYLIIIKECFDLYNN